MNNLKQNNSGELCTLMTSTVFSALPVLSFDQNQTPDHTPMTPNQGYLLHLLSIQISMCCLTMSQFKGRLSVHPVPAWAKVSCVCANEVVL
jgi:hypothetical protein